MSIVKEYVDKKALHILHSKEVLILVAKPTSEKNSYSLELQLTTKGVARFLGEKNISLQHPFLFL